MIAFFQQKDRYLRRVVFIAVTALPIIGLGNFVIMPALDVLAVRDAEITQQLHRLARLEAIAAFNPESLGNGPGIDLSQHYLIGPNEGLIGAKLQIRLKTAIQQSGAQLRRIQGLPAHTDGMLRFIGVRLEITGPIKAVHKAISDMETDRPPLFITNAMLKSARQNRRASPVQQEPLIDAQLDVFGIMHAGETR